MCWSGSLSAGGRGIQTDQRMRDAAGLRDRLPLQSLQGVKVLDFSAFLVKPVKQVELYDGLAAALGDREAEAPPMACSEASVGNDTGIGAACAGARILLVEDNSVNQAVATKLLEKMGGHETWPPTAKRRSNPLAKIGSTSCFGRPGIPGHGRFFCDGVDSLKRSRREVAPHSYHCHDRPRDAGETRSVLARGIWTITSPSLGDLPLQ